MPLVSLSHSWLKAIGVLAWKLSIYLGNITLHVSFSFGHIGGATLMFNKFKSFSHINVEMMRHDVALF